MRVDQYLWCIRVFKSRNIASNACKKGLVQVNGQSSKASREILPLDKLKVRKNQVWRMFDVLDIPKSRVGAKLVAIYSIEKTEKSVFKHHELQVLSGKILRDQGSGRPTKKERRDIDDLKLSSNEEDL
jgi:ribosome-associated heat shock protein Hsp15